MANTPANIHLGPAAITFNTVTIGHTEGGVTVRVEPSKYERKLDKYGDSNVDIIHLGEKFTITARLAQQEMANFELAFPPHAQASNTGYIGRQPGWKYSGEAHPLTLTPEDTTRIVHVKMWRAVVSGEPLEVGFNSEGDTVFEVVFEALVDTGKADGKLKGEIKYAD